MSPETTNLIWRMKDGDLSAEQREQVATALLEREKLLRVVQTLVDACDGKALAYEVRNNVLPKAQAVLASITKGSEPR